MIVFTYRCDMTWMYEYPKYIPVPMKDEIKNEFPKYNLFVYGEGAYAQRLFGMRDNIQLDGVPALFVHGNSGRYKQVISDIIEFFQAFSHKIL